MINYFGLQRFGSCGTKTHLVGVQVLKKQWKELIEGLLFRDCGDFETNKYIKEMYEKEEFAKAERGLNNKFKV